MKKIIIPISYFNGIPQSKLFEIDLKTKKRTEILNYIPKSSLAVSGKGFTQIAYNQEQNIIAVADYNQFHIIDTNDYKIIKSVSSNTMNDIHGIKFHNDLIIITNTGFDSIEIYNISGEFYKTVSMLTFNESISRFTGEEQGKTSDSYYDNSTNKSFNQRKIKDKFHLNNCTVIENRLIVTSFTKKTLIDLSLYKEIAPPLNSHIHDCFVYDNKIWITSVDGKIYFRNNNINDYSEFIEFVDLFKIGKYYGWCRGLNAYKDHFFIGITQINSEVSESRWNTDIPIEKTKTGVIKMNIKTKKIVDFLDFTDSNISRIFGFLIK